MPTTSKYGLPYPALSSAPNVPLDLQNLAVAVDGLGVIGGKRQTSAGAGVTTIETTVIDTQTLSMAPSWAFQLDFAVYFTTSIAATDLRMRIRQTSVSGTSLGDCPAIGTYVSPEQNRGFLRVIYKTGVTAELNYFAGTIVRIGGTGTLTAVAPTSLIVTALVPSTAVGDY